jgi:hypothetical protein
MAGIVAGADGGVESRPAAENVGRRRAAGIYGAIITAAILAAVGGHLPTAPLVVSVVVTLVVYWLAEEYAELLGEQIAGGRLPSRGYVRAALQATWPARVAGASANQAANVGLVAAVLLLTWHGWWAGRAAQLHGRQLLLATSVAALLGLAMIALKDLVLVHLH